MRILAIIAAVAFVAMLWACADYHPLADSITRIVENGYDNCNE